MRGKLTVIVLVSLFFSGLLLALLWWNKPAIQDDQNKKTDQQLTQTENNSNKDVLGANTIAKNIRDTANRVINNVTGVSNATSNTTNSSTGSTTTSTNSPGPTSTPGPGPTSTPGATSVPAATSNPSRNPIGILKPLPKSPFGATVTSGGVSRQATDGMPIYAGDSIKTDGSSRAQVVMPPNQQTSCPDNPPTSNTPCTYTRMDTNTEIQVNSNTSISQYNADVVVEAGKVWNRIKKLTGQESYDSQTGDDSGLVATVRGTSYGHSVGYEDNELTDRLYTLEGLVFARCKKNPNQQGEVAANTRAKFQCNKNSLVNLIQQLASMDQADLDWLIYNTNIDLPGQLEGNTPPTVTINTPDTDLANNVSTLDLDATVNDDGKPFGGTALVWTINGLPCLAICDHPFAEKTKVTIPSTGTYILKLTATDLSESASDQVSITANLLQDNGAPVVAAGPDIAVTLPGKAVLKGEVTDDGKPLKKVLVNWWTLVKGPASVSFSPSAFNATPTATFTKPGTYVLRLNSYDGDKQSYDDISVYVSPEPSPTPSPTPTFTPTPTPSSAAFLDISNDKKEAKIRIENLFSPVVSLKYRFDYQSAEGKKGVTGEKYPIEKNRYEQMIPFGSCSTNNICVYNTDIGNVVLEVMLRDAANMNIQNLKVEALTTPSPTPTQTPTPTKTPTPTPTSNEPQITKVTVSSSCGLILGVCINATFSVSGINLINASSAILYKTGYSRSVNITNSLKTNTTLTIPFIAFSQGSGYRVKVHFSSGQDVILPDTYSF